MWSISSACPVCFWVCFSSIVLQFCYCKDTMPSVQPGCKQQVYSSSSFATGNVRNQLPVLAPRSNQWTFRQVFRPVFCAKVQPMDLPVSFRPHSLLQGPAEGPSGKFSSQFFAPRSSRWTFRQVFGPIFCSKVQPMDLPASFPASLLLQGPTEGPSGKFSIQFLAPRSSQWTLAKGRRPPVCSISGIYVNVSAQKEPRLLATLGASP